MSQGVCILGSTGSIGCNTLDVISRNLDQYSVRVLTAHSNWQKLLEQCKNYQPEKVIIADQQSAELLTAELRKLNLSIQVESGRDAIINAARTPGVEIVVAAIVGAAGLLPTLTAVECGLKVLLANKEALVMSGELFMNAVKAHRAILLPVDSEHNAIFQSLPGADDNGLASLEGVHKILLTGSGGPFRQLPLNELSQVTPDQACAHPNWDMGRKISVDSATMMNKGLELIEACFLFGVPLEQIEIVVHPQSIVHSMVSYADGSVIAQMGNPDMRTPIAHTLAWPSRIEAGVEPLNFFEMSNLTFESPDFERFPGLKLAAQAMQVGGTAPCTLNAANEVAVEAFLAGKIRFTDIAPVIRKTMEHVEVREAQNLQTIIEVDQLSREFALSVVEQRGQ
ncbi:1-deoxy-D-xylulose-5-phosphate reductoisomerase [Aliikangiella marina]|uniref:1-deoxy-D-xylulose 5-phosphate reductoisomerase n=1 Tax=Aliikangiella marina TaxID=1712262 RepID=A0A545TDV0_9GAMM|nr:1-deoxy-D-xylulose-5-phosphate reductoisomerase [Aliikangiella marina]TQV75403.1 1-deoxy-D-xylulose-5-phosphate reductoisomerase [Aliikangiella marina]